jgi:hypothetical protein
MTINTLKLKAAVPHIKTMISLINSGIVNYIYMCDIMINSCLI